MQKPAHDELRRQYNEATASLLLSKHPTARHLGKFYAADILFNFVETLESLLKNANDLDHEANVAETASIIEASVRLSYDLIRAVVQLTSDSENDQQDLITLINSLFEKAAREKEKSHDPS